MVPLEVILMLTDAPSHLKDNSVRACMTQTENVHTTEKLLLRSRVRLEVRLGCIDYSAKIGLVNSRVNVRTTGVGSLFD